MTLVPTIIFNVGPCMHLRFVLILSLLLFAGACADAASQDAVDAPSEDAPTQQEASEDAPSEDDGEQLSIAVTTNILGDVVTELVGDDAQVEVLMPRGADAHSFGISARGATDMREADLLVTNGLGLEEGMADAIEAAIDEGVPAFEAAESVETIPFSGGEHDHADEDEHARR